MSHTSITSRRSFLAYGGAATVALTGLASMVPLNYSVDLLQASAHSSLHEHGLANFQAVVGQHFRVGPGQAATLRLVEATSHIRADDARPVHVRAEPFSLIFLAVSGAPLSSEIHEFHNPELGILKAFVSEVRADSNPQNIHYEVVFG